MLCDSLASHPMPCSPGTIEQNVVSAPAIAPYNGIIIASIICLTIILLAFIVKCLILKLQERKQVCAKPENVNSQDKQALKRYALIDKLLAFEESLAKNGSQHQDEEKQYRDTLKVYIEELTTQKPQSPEKPEQHA